jgi:hypothetical protein
MGVIVVEFGLTGLSLGRKAGMLHAFVRCRASADIVPSSDDGITNMLIGLLSTRAAAALRVAARLTIGSGSVGPQTSLVAISLATLLQVRLQGMLGTVTCSARLVCLKRH